MAKKPKNPPGKETSKRVGEAAGRLLAQLREGGKFYFHHKESRSGISVAFNMTRDVKAVAASALVQRQLVTGRKAHKK